MELISSLRINTGRTIDAEADGPGELIQYDEPDQGENQPPSMRKMGWQSSAGGNHFSRAMNPQRTDGRFRHMKTKGLFIGGAWSAQISEYSRAFTPLASACENCVLKDYPLDTRAWGGLTQALEGLSKYFKR